MFKGQPKGLYALALANTGERFGYYTMLAIFMLFLQAKFGWDQAVSSQIYSIFLAAVYFMPVVGGWLADRIGYGKCVVVGISVMFLGYLALAVPTGDNFFGIALMMGALLLISVGTGLFKGNLQVLVGNLYDDPKYSSRRDAAFSLFYMAINIGAMFAPSAATAITNKFLSNAGLIYKADIPALGMKAVDLSVYWISPRADYATWRSTRQSSGYDVRTFEVRARPVKPLEDLRPGMTVLVPRENAR